MPRRLKKSLNNRNVTGKFATIEKTAGHFDDLLWHLYVWSVGWSLNGEKVELDVAHKTVSNQQVVKKGVPGMRESVAGT